MIHYIGDSNYYIIDSEYGESYSNKENFISLKEERKPQKNTDIM